jgi:hypothetical protein
MGDDIKDVGAFGRISASQHKQWIRQAETFYLRDEALCFVKRKLARAPPSIRFRAAVQARKIARARRFPYDRERTQIEVHLIRE